MADVGLDIKGPNEGEFDGSGDDEMYSTWLYFVMICVALLVIGNIFGMTLTGKCPWNVYKKRKYTKVQTISSSDEDLSAVEEIDID